MSEVNNPTNWPDKLRWPVTNAWTAEKLAKLLFGLETYGITDDRKARIIARKMFIKNLSYSETNVPSSKRPANFDAAKHKVLDAGGEQLALTPKDSKTAYEKLLAISSPNVEDINRQEPVIDPADARRLLDGIRPLVDFALQVAGLEVENVEQEIKSMAN